MTRAIALDAYRYVSRNYNDNAAQDRKMRRKHGDAWGKAVIAAGYTFANHSHEWCAARIISTIEDALSAD